MSAEMGMGKSSLFPNRPDHPDFRLLAAVVRGNDERAEAGESLDKIISDVIDGGSLAYMANQRVLRVSRLLPNGDMTREERASLMAMFYDAFIAGAEFARKKGLS